MKDKRIGSIHVLEFNCQAPVKFYEHCISCARFSDKCPELTLGIELLRGRKQLVYNRESVSQDAIHASQFNCLAPLYYFEKSRKNCAHSGRCREEGLLLALLSGKKRLVHTQKTAKELPQRKRYPKEREVKEATPKKAICS